MVERGPTNGECVTMTLQERVTKVYVELFHHIPDLDKKNDATEYAVLHTALRDVMEACKQVAEQHAIGGPENPWGEGLRHAAHKIAFAIERNVGRERI